MSKSQDSSNMGSAIDEIESSLANVMTDDELDDIYDTLDSLKREDIDASMFTSNLDEAVADKLNKDEVLALYEIMSRGIIEDAFFVDEGRVALLLSNSDAEEIRDGDKLSISYKRKNDER